VIAFRPNTWVAHCRDEEGLPAVLTLAAEPDSVVLTTPNEESLRLSTIEIGLFKQCLTDALNAHGTLRFRKGAS
jgi:hypothetical protein